MTWRFFAQLNDPLAQVRIDNLDSVLLQKRIQVTFFCQHRFAFHDPTDIMLLKYLQDRLVMLTRIARPMHVRTLRFRSLRETFQVVGQLGERMLFDRCGFLAQ